MTFLVTSVFQLLSKTELFYTVIFWRFLQFCVIWKWFLCVLLLCCFTFFMCSEMLDCKKCDRCILQEGWHVVLYCWILFDSCFTILLHASQLCKQCSCFTYCERTVYVIFRYLLWFSSFHRLNCFIIFWIFLCSSVILCVLVL